MDPYELFCYAFTRTLAGHPLETETPSTTSVNWNETAWAAVALGAYCAKNNLLLTRSQFNSIHPKLTQP